MRKIKKYLRANHTNKGSAVCFKRNSRAVLGILQSLEPRILFDAAVGAELAAAANSAAAAQAADADVAAHTQVNDNAVNTLIHEQSTDSLASSAYASVSDTDNNTNSFDNSHTTPLDNGYQSFDKSLVKEVVFVDQNVRSYTDLLKGVDLSKLISGELEIVILKYNISGVAQITDYLNQFDHQIDAVHIVSEGNAGTAYLGSDTLNMATINQYQSAITQWNQSLSSGADILFYGCNIGQGASGEALVQSLHELTGADIAASSNLSGNSALGADWNLEIMNGVVTASMAFNTSTLQNYQFALATIQVTNTNDLVNGNTSSIAALLGNDGGDGISFREAIAAANNTPGTDTVSLMINFYDPIILTATIHITDNLILSGNGGFNTLGPITGTGDHEINIASTAEVHTANSNIYFNSQSGLGTIGIASHNTSLFSLSSIINTMNTAITINANNVELGYMSFQNYGPGPRIVVNGDNASLHHLSISANGTAIQVNNSQNTQIYNNFVIATPGQPVIVITGDSSNIDITQNNLIGLGFGTTGIEVSGTANTINIIANTLDGFNQGVVVKDSANNINISQNTMPNTTLSVDLNDDGITPNDAVDSDTGPNNLQNKPVLTAATEIVDSGINRYQVTGTLNSEANKTYRIEYFASNVNTDGQGRQYLGSQTVITDADGDADLNFIYTGLAPLVGQYISATASEEIVASTTYATSEYSAPVVMTDTLQSQMSLKDLNNSPGISRVTNNGSGLVLTGTINEPTVVFTNFAIRSALNGAIIESGNLSNLTINANGTWSYNVQTATLVPGAYFIQAAASDNLGGGSMSVTFGESYFAVTPAAGDVVPNELGGSVDTNYYGPNATMLITGGGINDASNTIIVVEGNVGDGLHLLITDTGYFYSMVNGIERWASSATAFTQTTPFVEGLYSYKVHIFSASTYDLIISSNNTIVDTTPISGTLNSVTADSTSDFATKTLTGTFTDNHGVDYILIGIAPHSNTPDINNFSTTVYQLSSLDPSDTLAPPINGTISVNANGTYTVDPGQFNLAPGTYDVLVIFVDEAGNQNLVGNTLVEGVNLFSSAIFIGESAVSDSTSAKDSAEDSVLSSLINVNPPNASTPFTGPIADNGLVINPEQSEQGDKTTEPSSSEEIAELGQQDQPEAQDSASEEQAAEQSQDQNSSQAVASTQADSNNNSSSGNRVGSPSNNTSNTTNSTSNGSGSRSSDSSSQGSVADNIATFFVNAADSVVNVAKESVNYAKNNPVVATGTAVAGGVLANSVIATHTVAAAGQAANGMAIGANAVGTTTTSANLAASTGRKFGLSSFSFNNNSKNNQNKFKNSSERAETEQAEEKEAGEECHCTMCNALHTYGPKIKLSLNKKKEQDSKEQAV